MRPPQTLIIPLLGPEDGILQNAAFFEPFSPGRSLEIESRREYVKIEGGRLGREGFFLQLFCITPVANSEKFLVFLSLSSFDGVPGTDRIEKVCQCREPPIEMNPWGDFVYFLSRPQHISQLILFPGHCRRCN